MHLTWLFPGEDPVQRCTHTKSPNPGCPEVDKLREGSGEHNLEGEKKTLQRGIAPAKPAAPNPRPAPLARAPRPPVSLAQFLGVRDSFWAFAAPSGCSWTLQSVSHCLLPSSQSDTRGHMARVKFAENVAGTADGVCKKTTECLPHHVASFKVYLPMRLHTF